MTYSWNIAKTTGDHVVPESLLTAVLAANSSYLQLESSLMEHGEEYFVTVTALNIFNKTDSASVTIVRKSRMPPLFLDGPATRDQYTSLPTLIQAHISLTPCLLAENITIDLLWTQLAGAYFDPEITIFGVMFHLQYSLSLFDAVVCILAG